MDIFKKYTSEIQAIFEGKNYNEHSFRTCFENLLNELKPKEVKIIHEPKSEKGQGSIRPDFKTYKLIDKEKELSYNHLVGFIECKNLDVDLNLHLKGNNLANTCKFHLISSLQTINALYFFLLKKLFLILIC